MRGDTFGMAIEPLAWSLGGLSWLEFAVFPSQGIWKCTDIHYRDWRDTSLTHGRRETNFNFGVMFFELIHGAGT
jgi:hypothetical protein